MAVMAFAFFFVSACGGGSSPGSGQSFAALTLSPASISTSRGNQVSSTLTTQVGGSFAGSLTMTATGAPEGVAVNFDPPTVAGSGSSNVTVSVAPGTPTGTYPITITSSGEGLAKTTTLTVTVTAEVVLSWNPSSSGDVIGYNVGRSDTAGGGFARLNFGLISGTSYIDDTVQSGHTYYYVAMAVSSTGVESAPSNEASAEVP